MWDRTILKSNAKIALKGRYWNAFGVTLVAGIIMGAFSALTAPSRTSYQVALQTRDFAAIQAQSGTMGILSIGSILFSIFVGLPIAIGLTRYYVQNHFGVTQFDTLFSGFRRSYMNGVGAMFVTNLFIGLWSLLLIIPGIVKALEYSMVSFILSDNPTIPGKRAREISRMMTNGEKGAIFVLILSFIGWYLLGLLCCGFGILFVTPYFEATMAELYLFLRDRAIQTNQINPAELGLVPPTPAAEM